MTQFAYQLHPLAEQEYLEAYLWYEQQARLGEQFAKAVRERLQKIVSNPEQYSSKKSKYREVIVDKTFPYIIVYKVDNKQRNLTVISIFHTSRNPKKKYRK